MVEFLKPELPKPKQKGGQPKLTVEDQLLLALEYWREDRSYEQLYSYKEAKEKTFKFSGKAIQSGISQAKNICRACHSLFESVSDFSPTRSQSPSAIWIAF